MKPKHWTPADFIVTHTSQYEACDGRTIHNRYGYCAKCQGDMQELDGRLLHYHSHSNYKARSKPRLTLIKEAEMPFNLAGEVAREEPTDAGLARAKAEANYNQNKLEQELF